MFHTSHRLRGLVRLLRPFPRGLSREILAGAAVVDGLVRRGRFHRVRDWAAAQPGANRSSWRLALALLANHGRFCAEEAFLGVATLEAAVHDVVLEGAHHLPAATTGAILLGFHLGPPRVWVHLRTLGYPVRIGGGLVTSIWDPRWRDIVEAGGVVYFPDGAPQDRLRGLYQIRDLLQSGGLVYLTAEGPFGREAFRVDLPGGPMIVRAGWLALRHLTRAPTFPVLTHRDGKRQVIVIYPALPPPAGDRARDAAQCRAVLAPLVESYVRRFPEQCRYLALPPWPTTSPAGDGALDRESVAP
jgi:lauroyl/myristoyl acyltransferase